MSIETMTPAETYPSSRLSCALRVAGILLVLGITLGIALNSNRLKEFETLGYTGAFLVMLLGNATVILPAPGLVIVFALGGSLNPVLVGLAGGLGAALGEITGYLTGASGVFVVEHTSVVSYIRHWMNRNGSLTVFTLSVIPNPFFDVAGLMAGAGRMPLWRFLLVAFFGKTIQATGVALAGALSLNWVAHWV